MRSAITLGLGLLIAAAAPGLRAQMNPLPPANENSATGQAGQTSQQAAKPPAKPATQTSGKPGTQSPAKPAAQAPAKPAPAAGKPAPQTAKPAPQAVAKPAAKRGKRKAKPAVKAVEKPAGPAGAPKAAAESEVKAARRDPFESLISHGQGKGTPNLPPGKAGLQVSTLRLDGIVRAPNGMIAVVSNPQARTYFLREGDHLYDGSVEKITMDGVSFHEEGKDAFGKPVERQVNKRIYSTSSGEQQ
jgi:Tfp pilus assembly protein PilP